MKNSLLVILLAGISITSKAQEKLPVYAPFNYLNNRELYLDSTNHHTSFQIELRKDTVYGLVDSASPRRSFFHRKLFREHLLEFRKPEYNVFIDFMPDFLIGASSVGNPHRNNSKVTWLNTRGVRLQANVGEKVYFETSFYENQAALPYYLDTFARRERIVPGQGEIKSYQNWKAFDFAYVNGLISYTPNKFLNFTLGYGNNNFIGDGYRSLLLSDIGFSYPYLRITGTLGNVQYTAMWAQFEDLKSKNFQQAYNDLGYAKKWGVFHYLDWNVSKKISIGLFDAVIWPDSDSTGRKRGFDWTYLNPIIFLRPAEFSVGSSDNAMVGMTSKYKVSAATTIYGQLLLDEFKLKELLKGDGWWGNKWSAQLGIKSFNVFRVPMLDVIGEFNVVRPFTYSYSSTFINYAHYNQSLAHPLGANFYELNGIASYRIKRWYARGQIMYAQSGLDNNSDVNNGQDIFKNYNTRASDYGHKLGQGLKTDLLYIQGMVSYILNPTYNLRVEMSVAGRQQKNSMITNKEIIFSFGLRSSFRKLYYDF